MFEFWNSEHRISGNPDLYHISSILSYKSKWTVRFYINLIFFICYSKHTQNGTNGIPRISLFVFFFIGFYNIIIIFFFVAKTTCWNRPYSYRRKHFDYIIGELQRFTFETLQMCIAHNNSHWKCLRIILISRTLKFLSSIIKFFFKFNPLFRQVLHLNSERTEECIGFTIMSAVFFFLVCKQFFYQTSFSKFLSVALFFFTNSGFLLVLEAVIFTVIYVVVLCVIYNVGYTEKMTAIRVSFFFFQFFFIEILGGCNSKEYPTVLQTRPVLSTES